MKFTDLDIHPSFLKALATRGFEESTPVQEAVLAADYAGRDLLVSSRTGSGKTVAFGLSIGNHLLGDEPHLGRVDRPLALVVAPTRELAVQVQTELQWLYGPAGARVVSCVGGMDFRREQRGLQDGAHIVVGTPGRLCDHLERKTLDLSGVHAVILDEADEMLDMGFRDELERILQDSPRERRTLLFSATLPRGIDELARRYQRDAARVTATSPETAHQDIEYRAHMVAARETELAVVNTLRFHDSARTLVFCATRDGVSRLAANLTERGFEAVALSGELSQAERTRALKALRDGRAKVLVATDVAARGLDLPEVGLVIHADLPVDASVLQHRSGRTGRAGRKGISVVLSPVGKRGVAERLLRVAKVKPEWTPLPSLEEIRALDQERLQREIASLTEGLSPEDLEVAKRLLEERSAEELVAGLVKVHRATRPAPEELPQTASALHRDAAFAKAKGSRATAPRSGGFDELPLGSSPYGVRSGPRPTSAPRASSGTVGDDGVWFRLNVGRAANADPKWLVPLICRRGNVTNKEIGRIQILDRESRFQISAAAAKQFGASAREPDQKDPSIRIEMMSAAEKAPARPPSMDRGVEAERPERRESLSRSSGDWAEPSARPTTKSFDAAGDRPATPSNESSDVGSDRPAAKSDAASSDRPAAKSYGASSDRPAAKSYGASSDRPAAKSYGASSDRPAAKSYGASSDRPARPFTKSYGEGSDRPARPAAKSYGASSDRPARPFTKSYGEGSDRPARPAAKSYGASSDRPARPFTKSYGEGSDRPARPAAKSYGASSDRPARPFTKSYGEGSDRPARPFPKSYGPGSDRPARPASKSYGPGSDRPARPASKSYGAGSDRPARPASKSYGAGSDRPAGRSFGAGGERPFRPATKSYGSEAGRPFRPAAKSAGGYADRPARPSSSGKSAGPKKRW